MIRTRRELPPKRDRSDEFVSYAAPASSARMATAADVARRQAARIEAKTPARVQQSIRDSAKGEDCLIRIDGCPNDPAMTILSHNRHQRAGKGGAIKALDLCTAYGCTYCDAVYDGQRPRPLGWTVEQVELAWYGAHVETLVRLRQKGLV